MGSTLRFYGEFPSRWGLGFHYSAMTSALMAISSLYSLKMLQKRMKQKYLNAFIILLLLNALFLYRVVLDGPFALSYNPAFYTHTKNFEFLNTAIERIPQDASIMTQNNLVPHFTHQKVWHLTSDVKKYPNDYYTEKMPDYILIDNHPGQNPNNHFGITDVEKLLVTLQKDKKYMTFYRKDALWIFKKT